MVSRTLIGERVRALWALYHPVRALVPIYLAVVALGVALEGLALAAIVTLISGETGVRAFYNSIIEALGFEPTDVLLVVLVGCLFVARSAVQYIAALLASVMVRRERLRLQVELVELYLNLSWERSIQMSHGEVNLLFNSHTYEVATFLQRAVVLMEGVVYTVGLTLTAVIIAPSQTFLALGLIGTTAALVGVIARRIHRLAETILGRSKALAGLMLQYTRSAHLLRAYQVTPTALAHIDQLAREREATAFRAERAQAAGAVIPDLLFVLALLAVVGISLETGSEFAEVGAVVALLYRVSQYLKRFADLSSLTSMLPTIRDVHRTRQMFRSNQAAPVDFAADASLPSGAIALTDVGYLYGTAEQSAVTGVTETVASGEFIGIVGSSGGGKSTLVQMLVGLLEPTSGAIRIGASTAEGSIAYVPQTPTVIQGSIESNVRWFRPIREQAVRTACERAGLAPVIARLPEGIHTDVADDGLTLSGGERQRLALARALAGEPSILVLDEATSALDAESEAAIQRAVSEMHGNVTVVAVAHRIATVMDADRVWVMEHGRIVESGPPRMLLGRESSRFALLSGLQGIRADDRAGP